MDNLMPIKDGLIILEKKFAFKNVKITGAGSQLKLKLQYLATNVKNWLIGKDPDAGKDGWQEKGMTEDEMVGWHHCLDGHEFEQVPVVGDGQGGLACYSPWGR